MANFYIDIIDTLNTDLTTSLELATKNSIVLRYNGKDRLDDLVLVGSDLSFQILLPALENTDAALVHLFTADENRYKVELRQEETDVLIWHGFLLPDSYTEPYKNGNLPIALEATDGIGRLKGKFLEDRFYTDEVSVITIVSECLKLTGLDMPLVFASGIDNVQEKYWHNIYLEGTAFVETNKRLDAYSILFSIAENLVAVVYQHLGKWYFEGLNKRSLVSYNAQTYTANGVYTGSTTITKLVRDVNDKLEASPTVNIAPPYGQITVNGVYEPLAFKETLTTEKNDGWSPAIGVIEEVYATDWYHGFDFLARAKAPDYKVYLPTIEDDTLLPIKLIQLLKRLYVKKGTKLKLTLAFSIDYFGEENSTTIDALINSGTWTNPFDYYVYLGTDIMATNSNEPSLFYRDLEFTSNKTAKLVLEFIAPTDGNLNILLRRPYSFISVSKIAGIFIDTVEIEDIAFNENLVFTATTAEDFTLTKAVDLSFVDDATAMSKAFRLSKLNENSLNVYNTITVPILSAFTQNGKFYSVVQLDGANLIADNIDTVFYDGALITINAVIYNYQDGEQMVVETVSAITTGSFSVRQYRVKVHTLDRTHWEQWTDSVYQLENKRFAEAVLGVYTRLFDVAYPRVDCTVLRLPVLFGDLVLWNYIEPTAFVPTALEFNFDSGKIRLRMSKSSALVQSNLVPPIVNAGGDLFLQNNASTIAVNATAFDPDGVIVSYLWQQVSGPSTALLSATNTEDVVISNLDGDAYTFSLTVTDNDGLTATDTVNIYRLLDYAFLLNLTAVDTFYTEAPSLRRVKEATYTLAHAPVLPVNVSVVYNVAYELEAIVAQLTDECSVRLFIRKNGILLDQFSIVIGPGHDAVGTTTEVGDFNLNYISTDVIDFDVYIDVRNSLSFGDALYNSGKIKLTVTELSTTSTEVNITGVPYVLQLQEELNA